MSNWANKQSTSTKSKKKNQINDIKNFDIPTNNYSKKKVQYIHEKYKIR